MKNRITIEEALRQGYEYFFIDGSSRELVHDIRDEAKDHIVDGDILILAEKSNHMILDAQMIFEEACEELHEGAFDNVYMSEEYKLFKNICEYVSGRLKDETQSYRETDIQLIALKQTNSPDEK